MTTDLSPMTMVAFGQVVTVRPIPTRQVTQIVIEIPENHHIAATMMLFGKNAFVLAANPGANVPFGVVPLEKMDEAPSANEQAERRESAQTPTAFRMNGLSHSVNPTRWLGIHCLDPMFIDWIGARDSSEAIKKVRHICGVESRSEIPQSSEAMDAFMRQIHTPFRAYQASTQRDLRAAS